VNKFERSCFSLLLFLASVLSVFFAASDARACIEIRNKLLPKSGRAALLAKAPKGSKLIVRLVYMTGYCGATNTPPGSDEISTAPYHARRGGGTYENPATLAVNPSGAGRAVGYGTMVFIPSTGWARAEDLCGACVKDARLRYRIDLWLGMDATTEDENRITGWYWIYFVIKKIDPDN
jgi:3D (Asp-Asp-Asp) domain-containing protein